MRKSELLMALRAAFAVSKEHDFYLIGSQAVHAHCKKAPAEILLSQECDLYPRNVPEVAGLLASELGRNSDFAHEHGFFVDIVTPDIAILPDGWRTRLKPIRAGKATAWALDITDLIVSKLAAGRVKDLQLVGALLKLAMANSAVVHRRIKSLAQEADREQAYAALQLLRRELGKA
jgi:hypothetical protein